MLILVPLSSHGSQMLDLRFCMTQKHTHKKDFTADLIFQSKTLNPSLQDDERSSHKIEGALEAGLPSKTSHGGKGSLRTTDCLCLHLHPVTLWWAPDVSLIQTGDWCSSLLLILGLLYPSLPQTNRQNKHVGSETCSCLGLTLFWYFDKTRCLSKL